MKVNRALLKYISVNLSDFRPYDNFSNAVFMRAAAF